MPASRLVFAVLVLSSVTLIFADEPAPESNEPKPTRAKATTAHLRQAVLELETAVEAAKLEQQEREFGAADAALLKAQIDALQKQFALLNSLTTRPETGIFQLRILEVPLDALTEIARLESPDTEVSFPAHVVFKNTAALDKRIAEIPEVRMVSRPQIHTEVGQLATILVGRLDKLELPGADNTTSSKSMKSGVSYECRYRRAQGDRITVETVAEISSPVFKEKVGDKLVPALTSARANLQAELGIGETFMIALPLAFDQAKPAAKMSARPGVVTLFLLTPTFVGPAPRVDP